jgi:dipeptidyl aminopeptidase/acylaminoacyl peptidase
MLRFGKPDVEQFFRTFAIQTFAVSPNENQLIFSTNLSGKFNLWAMDLPNQFPYPLTFIDQNCHGLKFDKQGRFVIALFDKDGDENTQIYALPPKGGELKPIRIKEGHRHMFPLLTNDGKRLYYTSTKDNPTYLNIFRYDLETDQEEIILQGSDAATYLLDVSLEEKRFIYLKHFANTYALAYVRTEEESIPLTPETDKQHTVSDALFVNENEIYLVTNFESDFSYLAKIDVESRTFSKVLQLENEDLSLLKLDKSSNTLYFVTSKGVEDYLYRYHLDQKVYEKVSIPVHVIDQLVIAESGNLYVLGRTSTRLSNIYKLDRRHGVWEALTNYGVPGVPQEELVEPKIITYSSFDGMEIEALFFKAKEEYSNGHVILWPHGGPQAAERKFFRALFQLLLNRGYSIFAPNFRGSTGYGLKFCKMVEGNWGHGPRLDNIAGLEWLIQNGYAERDKIFLMGGSFGGYLALLLHGRHPEYFKAVVDIFGPSNLFSFIESVPEHWKPVMNQWVGDPVKDKEKLVEFSPITYLDQMVKPMLVIQGANDPRVVKAESDQIVKALREKGRDVEYMVLEDEGHGFSKKVNEIKVYRAVLNFFEKHLS